MATGIKTMGELLNAVTACKTTEEATVFLSEYSKEDSYARENIGYLIGYCDSETRARLYKLFNLSHPLFNRAV